jgi:hypothetical protein
LLVIVPVLLISLLFSIVQSVVVPVGLLTIVPALSIVPLLVKLFLLFIVPAAKAGVVVVMPTWLVIVPALVKILLLSIVPPA